LYLINGSRGAKEDAMTTTSVAILAREVFLIVKYGTFFITLLNLCLIAVVP
jgi:hypothetical protein